jgi:large subunit ribosomal protein L9
MQVILLERIARLGQMGDEVRVRDGFARNFLLPQGKALRANAESRKRFESQRAELEARNLSLRSDAEQAAEKLNGQVFVVIRQAGETGQLYGSVSTRDIAEIAGQDGFHIGRAQIELNTPIKTIGMHEVSVALHPEVDVTITVNVARSTAEAERQASGEDLTLREEAPRFQTFDPEAAEREEADAEEAPEETSEPTEEA